MIIGVLTAVFESLWFLPLLLRQGKGGAKKRFCLFAALLGMTVGQVLHVFLLSGGNWLVQALKLDKETGIGLFVHCVTAVGVAEELAKFACGFLVLKLAKPKRKLDYILIMGAAGLGFSITEGILYASGSLTQILRWVMPFHLMWQMLMGGHLYEFEKAVKARKRGTAVKEFCIAFLVPILMHGVNDYLAIDATNLAENISANGSPVTTADTVLIAAFFVWLAGMFVFTVLTEKWAAGYVKQSRIAPADPLSYR